MYWTDQKYVVLDFQVLALLSFHHPMFHHLGGIVHHIDQLTFCIFNMLIHLNHIFSKFSYLIILLSPFPIKILFKINCESAKQ